MVCGAIILVALDAYFRHNGRETRRRCCSGGEAAQSSNSVDRRTADILSARRRRHRNASFSFNIFCVKSSHQRSRITGRQFGSFNDLFIDHWSLVTGRNTVVYQGMTLEVVMGLYYERFRNYSLELGTWGSPDPARYTNGANTYQFVESAPVGMVDAEGLDTSLPGPQAPIFLSRTRKKMPNGQVRIVYKYNQDLGYAVVGVGPPPGSHVQTFLKGALRGVSKLTELGEILKKMGDTLSQQTFQNQEWKGKAFPEVIKTYV